VQYSFFKKKRPAAISLGQQAIKTKVFHGIPQSPRTISRYYL